MLGNRYFFPFVVLLFVVIVVSALPVPLIMNAAKYAEVGREILMNGDWINLTIGGEAYDQKPPMLFWIAASVFQVFGFSIPLYKIAVLLIASLGVYSTYALGKLLYNKNTGLLAAFFWATSIGFMHFHNDIHTDSLLAAFVVFSVWQFMAYFKCKKWHQFLLGVVGVGLSMLTKGPVGLVIPAFAVGVNLLVHQQWKEIFHYRWLVGLVLLAIIISPALLGLLNQFGLEGIKFYFWTNNVGRVTGSYYDAGNDYIFYVHTSMYMLAPWTIFFILGMYFEIRSLFKIKKAELPNIEVANIAGSMLFVAILSVASQHNPHYLLSAMPFLFLISAKWCVVIFENSGFERLQKVVPIINKVVAILLLAVTLVMPLYFFPNGTIFYWTVVVAMAGGIFYFIAKKLSFKNQLAMLFLASSALLFTINTHLLPNMVSYHTALDASEVFNKQAEEGATLSIYEDKARLWNLLLYADSPGTFLESKQELLDFMPKPNAWIYTTEKGYGEMQELNIDMTLVKRYDKHRKLSSQSLRFLNPKTRAERFRTMYLVKLN